MGSRVIARKPHNPGRPIAWDQRLLLSVSLIVPLAGLLLFFVYPLFLVARRSFETADGSYGFGNYIQVLSQSDMLGVVSNSVLMSGATTLLCLVLGFAIAYALQRTTIRGRWLIKGALILPLLAPSLVQALGLIFLLGRNGVANKFLGLDIQIYGFWGLLLSNSLYALPQAVMIIEASLRNSDARYYDAAEIMGASGWRRFLDITLPNAKFGLISAAFVVFTVTITDFGNAAVIGGDFRVLATEIYAQVVGQMNFNVGAVVGMILLLPTLVSVYIERVSSQKQFGAGSESAIPVTPGFVPSRDYPLGALVYLASAVSISIVAIVVYVSFVKLWPYRLDFTLANYNITMAGGYAPLRTTLWVSLTAAVMGVVLLFGLALAQRSLPRNLAKLIYLLAILPVGVPGLVLGLSYVFSFNVADSVIGLLYGSALLIAFCNFYHYHSQGFLTMVTGLRAVPAALEETITSMGGSAFRGIRDAVVPYMLPTLVAVFFFLFMRSMVTLSAVIFLISPELSVAAVSVMRLEQAGFITQAAAFSTCIILTVLVSMGVMKIVMKLLARRTPKTA